MPFTGKDFQSLLRLLERRPDWRSELRRLLLTDELLSLPGLVRELAGKVAQLVEAQARTEDRLGRLEEVVAGLAEAQRKMEEELRALVGEVALLKRRDLERTYRERAAQYFHGILHRIRPVDHQELGNLVDDAVDAGRIRPEDKAQILECDVVVLGRLGGEPAYLLAEVSSVVDRKGVERARERAALLQKATGVAAIAAAAGQRATSGAREQGRAWGVWLGVDGAVEPPRHSAWDQRTSVG